MRKQVHRPWNVKHKRENPLIECVVMCFYVIYILRLVYIMLSTASPGNEKAESKQRRRESDSRDSVNEGDVTPG